MKVCILILLFSSIAFSQEEAPKLIELDSITEDQILEDEGEKVRVRGYVESTNTNATWN